MNKNIKIVLLVLLALLIAGAAFFVYNQKHLDVSDQEIIEILKTNQDVKDYTEKYTDFKIQSKEVLTKESIVAGQNGQNFKEVYYGLQLENNRYMKVQLMDGAGSNGFITVIDFKNRSVIKAFGILLIKP